MKRWGVGPNALGMPLRKHNLFMLAAGFAPQFSETPLYTSALERMNRAIELILRHQEPYPAFVMNRHFEVLSANQAGVRMISFLMGGRPLRRKLLWAIGTTQFLNHAA